MMYPIKSVRIHDLHSRLNEGTRCCHWGWLNAAYISHGRTKKFKFGSKAWIFIHYQTHSLYKCVILFLLITKFILKLPTASTLKRMWSLNCATLHTHTHTSVDVQRPLMGKIRLVCHTITLLVRLRSNSGTFKRKLWISQTGRMWNYHEVLW